MQTIYHEDLEIVDEAYEEPMGDLPPNEQMRVFDRAKKKLINAMEDMEMADVPSVWG